MQIKVHTKYSGLYLQKEETEMKINLEQTYLTPSSRKLEIEYRLAVLDKKLKTPSRTVEDIIEHIELLKEYRQYK